MLSLPQNEKGAKVVQQLFAELQDEENDGAIYRGEVLVSVKYKRENELVLIRLMKGYGLLSRDGQIHTCNPYVKIELKYNSDLTSTAVTAGKDCSNPENTPLTVSPKVETSPSSRRLKFTRSLSLLHNYEQFKQSQLRSSDHCNDINKLDLAQARPLAIVQEQEDKIDDSSSPEPLSFKHEILTTAKSKVVWHTRNPEFNELFLFHVTKEKLTSTLLITVMDKEIVIKDTCIGHTTVPLGTLSITGVQNIPPQWFTIKKLHKTSKQNMTRFAKTLHICTQWHGI